MRPLFLDSDVTEIYKLYPLL